jgi:hypothetical protein
MNKQKEIREKIGLTAYFQIKKAIKMAEETPDKKVFQVTKNKKQLQEKEFIQKLYPNLLIMTEEEWLQYAFNKLSPEQQKKVAEKIKQKIDVT